MLRNYRSEADLGALLRSFDKLQYKTDGGRVDMAVTQSGGLPEAIMSDPAICSAVFEISKIRGLPAVNVMINRLRSGEVSPTHRDWIRPTQLQPSQRPCIERWHLAVRTDAGVWWWDDQNGEVHMGVGQWWGPVPYWRYHRVSNHSGIDRYHLIVDIDTPTRVGRYEEDEVP